MTNADATYFRQCSSCKRPLNFGQLYFRCSVSTCNRPRMELTFCSMPCWEAHVPQMRHRDAWAEEARAPTAEQFAQQQEKEQEKEREKAAVKMRREEGASDDTSTRREVRLNGDDLPEEVLVVVSKLKKYIKARSGMNTSDGVIEVLSEQLRRSCDAAIRRAAQADRRTVMGRDFQTPDD